MKFLKYSLLAALVGGLAVFFWPARKSALRPTGPVSAARPAKRDLR